MKSCEIWQAVRAWNGDFPARTHGKVPTHSRPSECLFTGWEPPLGYVGVDRKLVVEPSEAAIVRRIFADYLELGSVVSVAERLRAEGVRSKRHVTKDGRMMGGAVLMPGALYSLLSNPTYCGAIYRADFE